MVVRRCLYNLQIHTVDLISIEALGKAYDVMQFTSEYEKTVTVPEMLQLFRLIFEVVRGQHPQLVDVPLCSDLLVNWLLNVYDVYVF